MTCIVIEGNLVAFNNYIVSESPYPKLAVVVNVIISYLHAVTGADADTMIMRWSQKIGRGAKVYSAG